MWGWGRVASPGRTGAPAALFHPPARGGSGLLCGADGTNGVIGPRKVSRVGASPFPEGVVGYGGLGGRPQSARSLSGGYAVGIEVPVPGLSLVPYRVEGMWRSDPSFS